MHVGAPSSPALSESACSKPNNGRSRSWHWPSSPRQSEWKCQQGYLHWEFSMATIHNKYSACIITPTGTMITLVNHLKQHVALYRHLESWMDQRMKGSGNFTISWGRQPSHTHRKKPWIWKWWEWLLRTFLTVQHCRRQWLQRAVGWTIARLQPSSQDNALAIPCAQAVPGHKEWSTKRTGECSATWAGGNMWTSCSNNYCTRLTCHFVEEGFKVRQHNLDTVSFSGQHTAAQTASFLRSLFNSIIQTHLNHLDTARGITSYIAEETVSRSSDLCK